MSNFSEVGHAKNVANFEDLISYCAGYGVLYNPSLTAIKIANLTALRTNALAALNNAINANVALVNAVDAREVIFDSLQKLDTRLFGALKASGASEQAVKDYLTIHRKMQGKRAKPIKKTNAQRAVDPNDPPVADPVHISVIQLSYDSMIEHYSKAIALLNSISAYNPNEADLKISALNTLLASMKTTNTAVIAATTNYKNVLIARNDLLYAKVNGLVDVAQEVKNYVKSVFGGTHFKYIQVRQIKFTKRKGY